MSGITFSGLATGLDTRAIIDALMAVERRPITALEQKKSSLGKSKNLLSDFQSKIEALQGKAKAIKEIDAFLQFDAKTDDDDKFFDVEASEKAAAGTYDVFVESLAKTEVQVSTGSPDRDLTTVVDATTFTFTFADNRTLTVAPSTSMTLDELANLINTAESSPGVVQSDVRANVVDTGGTGADRYKLVVTSLKEGKQGGFTVAGDSPLSQTATFFDAMTNNTSANTKASDAVIKLNGVTLTRSSNTIDDAIAGVTLTLKGENKDAGPTPRATRITISTNATATSERVKEFVDAYNEVVDFVAKQNELGEEGKASSPLFGDVTLRQVRGALRSIVGGSASTGNDAYSMLSQVGITADKDGKLTFTESKFTEALNDDSGAIKKLFADATSGIAGRVFSRIEALADPVDGVFKARLDGIDRQVRAADSAISEKERRLELFEQNQIKKFAALENLISKLQSQGSAFSSFQAPTIRAK
ncbi:MAG: flagellar filament capping protein FliD [Planctomycetes bacterium]|nr:flagellar filament capping protein FliD [Planctomycetota bacterium]MCB9868986.1 flagellar filament capping protein FliD [Planctomycetota bacterium]MCB9887947.1 flagellar filament capping protein FliD [Planctomycetota bacterium]